jgi:hypothetical protein
MRRLTQPSAHAFLLQIEGCGPAVGQSRDGMIGRAHRDYPASSVVCPAPPSQICVAKSTAVRGYGG